MDRQDLIEMAEAQETTRGSRIDSANGVAPSRPDPLALARRLRRLASGDVVHVIGGDSLFTEAAQALEEIAKQRESSLFVDRVFAANADGPQSGWMRFLIRKRAALRRELDGLEQLAGVMLAAPSNARATLGQYLWAGHTAQSEQRGRGQRTGS